MSQLNNIVTTFGNNDLVTAAKLNSLVVDTTLTNEAVTGQTASTGTLAGTDVLLGYQVTANALVKIPISTIRGNASLGPIVATAITTDAITTPAITAGANSDIVITPNNGTIVTGQAYTSGDGLTVTVTSTAHILTVGQVILVASAGTGYNGTFRVATVLTNSFTYVMTTAATAGSGTLSYTKKGLIKNPANESIAGNLYVDGNAVIAGTTIQTGTVNITGAASLTTAPTTGNHITNKTYVDGTVSKTENGYCRLPNGLILQWATGVGSTTEISQTITFPIAFPNACLNVQVSCWSYYADTAANTWFQEIEKTTTYVVVRYQAAAGSALYYCTPRIFAIGH